MAVCPLVAAPPVIDGDLSDPCWRGAAALAPFVLVATHEQPTQPTTCLVVRDPQRLYFAFECQEANMADLSTVADGRDSRRAWADDCVQVFVARGDPQKVYYRIIVTAGNVQYDERVADGGQDRHVEWNSNLQSQTQLRQDRWTCEMAIELASLADDRPVPDRCTLNVARAEQAHHEFSSWAPLNADFHEYRNFGALRWQDGPVVTGVDLPTPFIGRNEFRLSLGDAPGECVAEVQVQRGSTFHTKAGFRIGPQSSLAQSYRLEEEGSGAVRLIVRQPDGHEPLCASPLLRFRVPPVISPAAQMGERLAACARALKPVPERRIAAQVSAQVAQVAAESRLVIRQAQGLAAADRPSREDWESLVLRCQALKPRVRMVEHKTRLAAEGIRRLPPFALGTDSSLRKLPPDDADYSLERVLRLRACQRERESAQVVVASLGGDLQGLLVDWTDLAGPAGARIAREHVSVSQVGYVTTRPPVYPVDRVGPWPDPLLPLGPLAVPAAQICPLWVTVEVPAGTPPGQYTGELHVRLPDGAAQSVKLGLEVWPLELPLHGRLRTAFGTVPHGDVAQWYGLQELPEDFRRQWHGLLLRNRVNPAGLYVEELWPPWEDFEWCREHGLNALCLGNIGSADPQRLERLADDARQLLQRGLLGLGYVYGFGGSSPEEVEYAARTYGVVRRLIPGLRRASPMAPTRPLWGHVNIWGTLTSEYDHRAALQRRRMGEEVWWYVCCGPRHPYANFFIDYPATDARTLFWAAFKYGIAGFFYYEVAMWASNLITQDIGSPSLVIHDDPEALQALREGKRWPEVPWNTFTFSRYNGDGQLIYPGPDRMLLPSLRLEVIRDGIEDYELLALLETLIHRLRGLDTKKEYGFLVDESVRLLGVNPQVVQDLTRFTSSPAVVEAERTRVARQAIRVQRVLQRLASATTATAKP